MVEPSFLVGIAVLFVVALAFILKQTTAAPETEKKKGERKVNKQPKKTKGPQRNSLKKDRRPADVKEWVGVDNPQKEAQEMLEFLKGKDPAELAKQHNQGKGNKKKQQQQQQGKKPKVQESSEDSASESEDGFSKIVKKPKIEKKKDNNKKKKAEDKESRGPSNKPFFKPPPGAEGEVKPGEKKPKRERKPQSENAVSSTEDGAPQERKREKRERPEGERRERPEGERKDRPEGERREKRENPDRPQRKPLPTVAPIVKYEQADLTDILASITQDFDRKPKPKPKANNNKDSFKFYRSEIPTGIVVNILEKVEARDLVALSRVNHFFSSIARKDSLWRKLLFRDFGVKDAGKSRNCRLAYKAEYVKKRKFAAKKKEENKAAEAPVEPVQQEESKNEDQSAAKEPKQKKDNKKKKAEEKPATDATAED